MPSSSTFLRRASPFILILLLLAPDADAAKRSAAAKFQFRKEHPCPATNRTRGPCPGYVIDHVIALKRGGADHPSNMQWQTVADAKVKDRWE